MSITFHDRAPLEKVRRLTDGRIAAAAKFALSGVNIFWNRSWPTQPCYGEGISPLSRGLWPRRDVILRAQGHCRLLLEDDRSATLFRDHFLETPVFWHLSQKQCDTYREM